MVTVWNQPVKVVLHIEVIIDSIDVEHEVVLLAPGKLHIPYIGIREVTTIPWEMFVGLMT